MELPKRKSMRLKGYDYSQNGAYFVTICTHNRECLFGEIVGANLCVRPNDPHIIIEKHIIELENKYKNVVINKYIIMPNHIHFILSINNKTGEHIGSPLHEMIQWFKTQTTNEYIHRRAKYKLLQITQRWSAIGGLTNEPNLYKLKLPISIIDIGSFYVYRWLHFIGISSSGTIYLCFHLASFLLL